jgi:hypothetical protein
MALASKAKLNRASIAFSGKEFSIIPPEQLSKTASLSRVNLVYRA